MWTFTVDENALNPVQSDLIARRDHRAAPAGAGDLTGDKDIAARRVLLIDADPVRPAGISATGDEKAAARAVADEVRGLLTGIGWPPCAMADGGNGWHLLPLVELPNDDDARALVRRVLLALAQRFDTDRVKIDRKVFNAARIVKLYGTLSRKGDSTPDRPHRRSELIDIPAGIAPVPRAELEALAGEALEQSRPLAVNGWTPSAMAALRPSGGPSVIDRARAYVAKMPESVSGQGGHDAAFNVALTLTRKFDLTPAEARPIFEEYNARCSPPWSDREIDHKLRSAREDGRVLRGRLLNSDGLRLNGYPHHAAPATAAAGTATFAAPIPVSMLRLRDAATLWLWHGYLAVDAVTLFPARWKSGKGTMLGHLRAAIGAGRDFCGRKVKPGRVLYVAEESESILANRRDKVGFNDTVRFIVRPFVGKPHQGQWAAFIAYLGQVLAAWPADLVIFDTLASVWPVRDENDASEVQAALMPLRSISEGRSLMLVHHARKGDGTEATASRGSGALPGFADILVELRRFAADVRDDRRRVLTGYGRYGDTPAELTVELTVGGDYVAHGDWGDASFAELAPKGAAVLPAGPPGMTGFADWWRPATGGTWGKVCDGPDFDSCLDLLIDFLRQGTPENVGFIHGAT